MALGARTLLGAIGLTTRNKGHRYERNRKLRTGLRSCKDLLYSAMPPHRHSSASFLRSMSFCDVLQVFCPLLGYDRTRRFVRPTRQELWCRRNRVQASRILPRGSCHTAGRVWGTARGHGLVAVVCLPFHGSQGQLEGMGAALSSSQTGEFSVACSGCGCYPVRG